MQRSKKARGINMSNDLAERKNEVIQSAINMKFYPEPVAESMRDRKAYQEMPFSKMCALGTGFESVAEAFQAVFQEGGSGLYRVTVPKGCHLAEFRNGNGYLGTAMSETNSIAGQSVLNPILCSPTALFMASTLFMIDHKLDAIREAQREITQFMDQKERSEIRGNLNFLADILNNYRYNWDNEKFKDHNHIKVLDIKQSAEQKINFYQEQIKKQMPKEKILSSDQEVKKLQSKMLKNFEDYQLAVYSYAFSAFVEVLLLENFDAGYLDAVTNKIQTYSITYRELYTKVYDILTFHGERTIQNQLLKGLAGINRIAGQQVEKIPLISKSQLDESLIAAGKKIEYFGKTRTADSLAAFIDKQSSYVQPFIENIEQMKALYNQPLELLFDRERLYISA